MKTKAQKAVELEAGKKLLKASQTVVFADFSGVNIESIKKLKKGIKEAGATFKVLKKRLLKIAFKDAGIDFDPTQFDAQVGAIFIPGDLSSAAAPIYKFSRDLVKEKKDFKVLGAYDVVGKVALTAEQFTTIAKLPTKQVLLGQLVGMLTVPIRQFMSIIDQLSKKTSPAATVQEEPVVAGS